MLGPLETFCQKDPDNPICAQALSVIRAVLGQKDAAIKEAERAPITTPAPRMIRRQEVFGDGKQVSIRRSAKRKRCCIGP